MAARTLERGVRVGIIGGMFDKGETLLRAAKPLIDAGHEVEVFESNWFKRESGKDKLSRAENFLDELRPEVIYGASAGGLLAVVAGFQKDYLRRISTAAAPLHRPRNSENTPKLRAVTFACPSLRYMRDEFYRREIHGRLNDTDQEILIVTGSIDEIVPPNLSRIDGYRVEMQHIKHVVFETPHKAVRKGWAHTYTTRKIYGEKFFQSFVAGEPLSFIV